MGTVNSASFQIQVVMSMGFVPVLKVRDAHPIGDGGNWVWSRWRNAGFADLAVVNAMLMQLWK